MAKEFINKRILLGVSGSIAAYKAVNLASSLTGCGAQVPVIMTAAAQKFIQPLSFRALTRQPVYTDMFADLSPEPRHITLAESAEIIVLAPATANCIAKWALGIADDLLSCVVMASDSPKLIAPAMNDIMYNNPATQANLNLLQKRGFFTVGPETGKLASGKLATGRMSEPDKIIQQIKLLLKTKIKS